MTDETPTPDAPLPKRPTPKRAKPARPQAPRMDVTAPIAAQPVLAQPVVPLAEGGEGDGEAPRPRTGSFLFFTAVPSWLTSMIVHTIVLLLLALLTTPLETEKPPANELVIGKADATADDLEEFDDDILDPLDAEALEDTELVIESDTELTVEDPVLSPTMDVESALLQSTFSPTGLETAQQSDLAAEVGSLMGSGLSGRGQASRARMLREGGGTKGSEEAVALALRWLAAHQLPDGGWHLDHRLGTCQGRCGQPGDKAPARNGATALALLPFLGAGHTHVEGEYQEVVKAGLTFLVRNIKLVGLRGSLVDEGNYYSHGLGAIALCEAYAMTGDKALLAPAQSVINETVWAQDPIGGGWRYSPQQAGDTSAVGWQLMALKSAHMSYLQVPAITVQRANAFLDSVQSENGARYGYADPGGRKGTTSVGLLCRMYLGWKRDHPALTAGVEYLAKEGPSDSDLYYNYYATQVMRHYGGEPWDNWNEVMRDHLVKTQSRRGHEEGSWYLDGKSHATKAGGRLYETAMATMILEVYYRHLPLYQQEAAEEDFPL